VVSSGFCVTKPCRVRFIGQQEMGKKQHLGETTLAFSEKMRSVGKKKQKKKNRENNPHARRQTEPRYIFFLLFLYHRRCSLR